MRWAGHVVRMEGTRGVYRVLVGKSDGKRPLGRSRSRWEDNFKVDELLHLSVVYMPLFTLACVLFCTTNKLYLLHLYACIMCVLYIYIYICVCVCVCVCVFTYGAEERCIQSFGWGNVRDNYHVEDPRIGKRGGFSVHHQELIKLYVQPLVIVMLSCCLPLVWMGRQQESMTIPKAAHTVL